MRYLTSLEVQARWVMASKYFSTQGSTEPLIVDFAAEDTQWSAAKDLIANYGVPEPAFASWQAVRSAIRDQFNFILEAETVDEIVALLVELNEIAAELVAEIQ